MALTTFNSSFFFVLAIFVAFTVANCSIPNKNENINRYRPTLLDTSKPSNIIHKVEDINAEFGPNLGEGHGNPPGVSNAIRDEGYTIDRSTPSPGEGHGSTPGTSNAIHDEGYIVDQSGPSPGEGHGSPPGTNNAIRDEGYTVDRSAPSPGEGHGSPPGASNAIPKTLLFGRKLGIRKEIKY